MLDEKYLFTVLPQGCVSSPAFCHDSISRHPSCLECPQSSMLIRYIEDIMLIRGDKQEVTSMQEPREDTLTRGDQ